MRQHHQIVEASEQTPYHRPMANSAWADVWRVPILLVTLILIACVPALIWYASSHWDIASEWVEIGLVVVLGVVGIKTYFYIQARQHHQRMSDLDRREREAEVGLKVAKQQLLTQARQDRANVKVHETGALEVVYSFPERVAPRAIVTEEKSVKELPPPKLELPGRCDLSEMLEVWRPSPQEILLGIAPGGQTLVVPLKSLCHVALAGATGEGKSVLMRLLLSQILYVNAQVMLCDPHYADVDPESGEDWRPIRRRLVCAPAVNYTTIKDMLKWMATSELPARLRRRFDGVPIGIPYFLAMDELPAIIAHVPEAPQYIAEILREGRKVGIYLVSAAQDWLVKTIGGSGAVRDCFRTAFYVGGDATSARVLLDVRGNVDDGTLGKGIVMLRSKATPMASLTRVPYVSNDALSILLSAPATAIVNSDPSPDPLPNDKYKHTGMNGNEPGNGPEPESAVTLIVREMIRQHKSQSEIIAAAFPGMRNVDAIAAYRKVLASLMNGFSNP